MGILVGLYFFWGGLPEKGAQFYLEECELHRNYGMVVFSLSFLCDNDNLTLKLHQEKRSYLMKDGFYWQIQVGSVPGMSVALAASKKVSKSIMSMMQGH